MILDIKGEVRSWEAVGVGLALAVAVFALLVSFVSASAWRVDADFRFLAAVGGTMLNIVTGCIVYAAVRLRGAKSRPASGLVDEDLAREDV